MIGLCIEVETSCSSCGKPLPINALAETIVCTQCMHTNKITTEEWKEILADMLNQGPTFDENDGRTMTIMGARTYKIMYGRQNPKFTDTKTYIQTEEITKAASLGKIINPKSNIAYSIRPLPSNYKEACPNVNYLLCEDFTQLPHYNGPSVVLNQPPQGELIPFNCPNCAGTLQIDGSERMLKCQFCGNESYIPDETWQKLHPVKTKQRFYFLFDENRMVFNWDSDLWDIVSDADSNIYISIEPVFGSDDKLWIMALNPDLTIKWKRNNLKFQTHTIGGEAKLGLTSSGELMIWSGDRNTMLLLSAADGTEIKHIGKKCEESEKQNNTILDFTQCRYIAADIDGNYFALVNRDKKDSGGDTFCEFVVVDKEGNLHKPWKIDDAESKGFFGSLKKAFSGMGEAPYFEKIKDKVYRTREFDVKISVGLDGSYYLLSYKRIAKYDRSGKQIYLIEIPKGYIPHKIAGDKQGNAYYLLEDDDNMNLIKISADGSQTSTLIKSIIDGGSLCKEDMLALSANETIYCAGYGGRIRKFDLHGKLLYASGKSLEEEKDLLKKIEDDKD